MKVFDIFGTKVIKWGGSLLSDFDDFGVEKIEKMENDLPLQLSTEAYLKSDTSRKTRIKKTGKNVVKQH